MDNPKVVPRSMAYHLLEEMTDHFSKERELGSGTYGKVYLGQRSDGKKIAIKMLHPMLALDDEQFEKEYHNLENLRHCNIVQLVGYCNETRREYVQYEGKNVLGNMTHRALCFEYMQKGSLHEFLSEESDGHDWCTRYAIIKGICMGLKYLHEELKPPLCHLDLKPANVLLDENKAPKIADFGLSRFFGTEQTRITTSGIGTVGYLPPEYIEANIITVKFDIFSLGVIIIKIMTGLDGYFRSSEMSSQQFTELVHENWKNRLQQATSVSAWESYSVQIKICTEIALSCVEADRSKRPSIGVIVNKLNETETAIHYPSVLRNDPGTSMDQGRRHTHVETVEEEKWERKGVSESENCFGEVVDDYKLDKMARYMGKQKTQEDRAREAWNLVNEDDKDAKASKYVDSLKATYGNGQSTLCLVYNATGDTLYLVANHDWFGYIGRAPYPAEIGNGQWAAFHHVHKTGDPSGSVAAVVYRGKRRDGQDQDYLIGWSTPWGFWYRNKAYCEIGSVNYFQYRPAGMYDKVIDSDYSSNAKADGCEIDAKIGTGDSPKFIARITSR